MCTNISINVFCCVFFYPKLQYMYYDSFIASNIKLHSFLSISYSLKNEANTLIQMLQGQYTFGRILNNINI